MKTISIQIGNTDNKLTQSQWANYCNLVHAEVQAFCEEIFFSAPSVGWADWQSACWVFSIEIQFIESLKLLLSQIGKDNGQESIAWLEGITEFI